MSAIIQSFGFEKLCTSVYNYLTKKQWILKLFYFSLIECSSDKKKTKKQKQNVYFEKVANKKKKSGVDKDLKLHMDNLIWKGFYSNFENTPVRSKRNTSKRRNQWERLNKVDIECQGSN